MATIREVAEAAGVSLATASRVLGAPAGRFPVSRKTSQRVRAAAEKLGYRVNYHMQAVASGRANAVGFCAEVTLSPQIGSGSGNFYFDELRRGAEYATQERGAALMSIHPGQGLTSLQRGLNFMRERRIDAIVVPATRYVCELPAEFERWETLPVVVLNSMAPIRRPRVVFDVPAATRLIVEHLAELRHRHILWVGPEQSMGNQMQREQYVIANAWEAGITGKACRVPVSDLGTTANTEALIARVADTLRRYMAQTPRDWTAIVAFNDQYAIGCCAALHDVGLRVPADVSVVGFDNSIASYCLPPLTTIDHRFFDIGCAGAELAVRLVNADEKERLAMLDHVQTIEPRLIVRQSTGPCPSSA